MWGISKQYFVFFGTEKYMPEVYSRPVVELGLRDQFSLTLDLGFTIVVDGIPRFIELRVCNNMNDFYFCVVASLRLL